MTWGLRPAYVTGLSWYSSIENLKFLKNEKVGFLFGVADNRKVSIEKGKPVQAKTLDIPDGGMVVYLKDFGWVKIFCQNFKNEARHYALYLPDLEALQKLTRQAFKRVHDLHGKLKVFIVPFSRFVILNAFMSELSRRFAIISFVPCLPTLGYKTCVLKA